jgi:hypothetical protein
MVNIKKFLFTVMVLLAVGAHAQDKQAKDVPAEKPGHIEDNSFLIEEAYNQEWGVVQHIQSFTRLWNSKEWTYSFTQEWPLNPAPKHQLSYTLTGVGASGAGGGLGDTALNWRYQVLRTEKLAFSPRVTLLAPTGDSRLGRGVGGTGVQFNLPFSAVLHPKLVSHWNLGGTIVPNAKNAAGDKSAVYGYNFGQSFIYLAHPRFNVMLETIFNSTENVVGPNKTLRENSAFISPGIRWAHNFENGLQIVPGVAVPTGIGSSRGEAGVIFYLSFEHPFKRKK